MNKTILIDGEYPAELRVATIDDKNNLLDLEYLLATKKRLRGNIYIAVITRVEPGLQAAFIDYGNNQSGFLPFDEISPAYYNNQKKLTPSLIKTDQIAKINCEQINANHSISNTTNSVVELPTTDANDLDIKNHTKTIDNKAAELETDKSSVEKIIQIQDVIQTGQALIVQVTKEERGHKGATFTTYISLIGKYCILLPNRSQNNGISKKITDVVYKQKVFNLIDEIGKYNTKNSLIVRTAANKVDLNKIKNDYIYLVKRWNQICQNVKLLNKRKLIHVDENILQNILRDIMDQSVTKVIIQGQKAYDKFLLFAKEIDADCIKKTTLYNGKIPLFTIFNVEQHITELYQPIVNLKSGGHIVINPAEGMTLIDINSGKSNLYDSIQETAIKTNLEATSVIAHQLKLREISGLVIIDFIDMQNTEDNALVKKTLEKALSKDSAKVQLGEIGSFGLLEMSRQRSSNSFLEVHSQMCPCCLGKGVIRNQFANDILILRTIASEVSNSKSKVVQVNVYSNADVILSVLNNRKQDIINMEKNLEIQIRFIYENNVQLDQFSIEKIVSQ